MGCNRECNCVQQALGNLFYKYGHFLAKHPWPFVIVPVTVTALLAIGLIRVNLVSDPEYLYSPTNAPSRDERALIQDLFPENDNHLFTFIRQTEIDGLLQIIITTSDRNILIKTIFQAIYEVDEYIRNIQVSHNGNKYVFDDDICAKWMDNCVGNEFLYAIEGQNVEEINITYPFHDNKYLLSTFLLTVTTNEEDVIQKAEAVMLSYHGRYLFDEDKELTDAWLKEATSYLQDYSSDVVEIVYQTSKSLEVELDKTVASLLPLFTVSFVLLLNFAVFSTLMLDWVRSKPYVALAGEGAAIFGMVSALGLLSACGLSFANVVGTMPFVIIGIGLDDLFIIISAWRYTDYTLDVPERVALTFKSAAVSITFTSLTDTLAFCVGAITNFRFVQLFCAYTGIAVVFVYIYMITFTGGILVFSGRREANNRHGLTLRKIKPKTQCSEKSKAYKLFCTGGLATDDHIEHDAKTGTEVLRNGNLQKNDTEQENPRNITIPLLSKFLADYFAPFLMKIPVKVSVLGVYVIYLAVAIWGCFSLKEGLDPYSLAPEDSHLIPFNDKFNHHFKSVYGLTLSVTFTDSLDYTDFKTLAKIDEIVNDFKENELFYSDELAVNSWLHSFQNYLSLSSRSIEHNITDMAHFISILRSEFLSQEIFVVFQEDVVFNSGYNEITSSRLFIQGSGTENQAQERKFMVVSREIADSSDLSVSVFAPYFIFLDQFEVVLENTMQNLGIAIGAILLVSLLFIPSLVAVLWVTLATISICTGVVGYMALWDVRLESVSMIYLIMCIGFSVDFAAHISYHFVICKNPDANDRAKEVLGQLGMPIFQGALSTILGVVILASSSTFRTFFKLVFLVMLFGIFHSLFLLPVILSWFGCRICKNKPDSTRSSSQSKVSPHVITKNEQPRFEANKNETDIHQNGIGQYVTEIDVITL